MKPSIQTLGQILYSPSQYVIPVFQRNYRWELAQWEKLWESLGEIQRAEKQGNHFMGFLVFVPGLAQPGQHTTFHLIDGQQRLSTSSILLAAIRNVARSAGHTDLADEIHDDYLVHPRKKGDQHFRLLPKERDHDSYVAIVSGQGRPVGRMADALDYFEARLSSWVDEAPERLRQTFDTVCQRFEFMFATLESENAYSIFKSLNSTGVPLGQSDLIRNFVFMHVPPDEQDDFDRDLWRPLEARFARADGTLDEDRFSGFFRDFLMSGGRYVPPRETFSNFESRYEATNFSPRELTVALTAAAVNFAILSGREPDASPRVTRALEGLNALESSTTYPLLLALFAKRADGVIGDEGLAAAIEMLRGFILRRFVAGESSRGYGQMFVRALAGDTGDPVATLEAYLLNRGWPDDHQFTTAFVAFPLYQRAYAREVLLSLERARGHKEPADLNATQVEHVLPQTLSDAWRQALGPDAESIHADWLHRPGNLTLSAYNQELWNHPFATKRQHYAASNVVITRELAGYERWTEEEIRERGERLAHEAARIWIGPAEQVARPQPGADDDEAPGRRELRKRFWAGLNDYLAAHHPELPEVEPRPSNAVRVPSLFHHVGTELRFGIRDSQVGLDVLFWREASRPVWEAARMHPEAYDALVETPWEFSEIGDGPTARMAVTRPIPGLRDPSTWQAAFRWLAATLSITYEQVLPMLREEMRRGAGRP